MNGQARELLTEAYELLYYLNNNTNNMDDYFRGVGHATQLVAEALDSLEEKQ
jgi:hypothetical protein